jgi:hypothetical protein
MSIDERIGEVSIVDQIRELDRVWYVHLLACNKVGPEKEVVYVKADYYRCGFQVDAENEARKAVLEQLINPHKKVVPSVAFDTRPKSSGRRPASSLLDVLNESVCLSLEFHILESREVLPAELQKLAELIPFAENHGK